MSNNNILVQKEFQVDNQKIKLFKTLPLKPEEMYDFFSKYLSFGKFKPNHQDFKHIFDYIDSIKINNNSYLLSLLSIPQSPSDTNGLGNFFGNKINNISNDLQIFPFGNVIRANLSLISKRSCNHPIFIIVSIKGNKNLNDPFPSNQNNKDNLNKYNSIGNYIIDNWVNNISKRYINYVNEIGFNMCVDIRFLKNINNNHKSNDKIDEHIDKPINEHIDEHIDEHINEDHIEEDHIEDEHIDEDNIEEDHIEEENINIENKSEEKISSLKDIQNETYPIIINKNYCKYQEEIINLKKMIFYLINNNGKLYSNIYQEFSNDSLKLIFGNDFMSFIDK